MAKAENKQNRISFQNIFPFLGLGLILVLFTILTKGKLFSSAALKSTLNDGLYILMGTAGFTLLCAEGEMDFSIGANMGVSCAVCCLVAKAANIYIAVPAAILTGIVIGLINGLIVTKTHIMSMIATMGMMFILQGLVLVLLNGSVLQAPLDMLKMYTDPLKLFLLIATVVLGYLLLEKTRFGRIAKATGACPEAVRQTGISSDHIKLVSYLIVGGLCGILGFVSLARTGSATNSTGGTLMFNALCATLMGAVPLTGGPTTKFRGAILGTLTISFLVTGMTLLRISATNQQLIKGIIFLVAVGVSFDRKNMKVIK